MTKKRVRSVPIYVWVRPDELEVIRERMAEAGIRNMSAYIRKMALGGYVLHVDLEPVKELVSLQRRCANNLNQAAIHANSYGGLYPDELKRLQKDYSTAFLPSVRDCSADHRNIGSCCSFLQFPSINFLPDILLGSLGIKRE